MRKIIIFIIYGCVFWGLATQNTAKSQDIMLLRVESGGSIHFSVNSLLKYNNGMALENWTRLAISFSDTIDPLRTWDLGFEALSDSILGDYGNKLALEYLVLEASNGGGNIILGEGTNGTLSGEKPLSNSFQTLITNVPQGSFDDNKLYISFRLGKGAEALMGNPSDYYFIDIRFRIIAN